MHLLSIIVIISIIYIWNNVMFLNMSTLKNRNKSIFCIFVIKFAINWTNGFEQPQTNRPTHQCPWLRITSKMKKNALIHFTRKLVQIEKKKMLYLWNSLFEWLKIHLNETETKILYVFCIISYRATKQLQKTYLKSHVYWPHWTYFPIEIIIWMVLKYKNYTFYLIAIKTIVFFVI